MNILLEMLKPVATKKRGGRKTTSVAFLLFLLLFRYTTHRVLSVGLLLSFDTAVQ